MKFLIRIKNRVVTFLYIRISSINKIVCSGTIHSTAKIKGSTIFGNINIGEGCKIINASLQTTSTINIGRYTSLSGPNIDIYGQINSVNIGAFCSIARNVTIQEFNHNYKALSSYYINQNILGGSRRDDIYSNGDINIGNDVWIGAHCIILSGAKIGNGVVVAANSVVTGEIPDYSIVGGSPAKILKYRFDNNIIKVLQDLRWWNWPLDKIKRNKHLFQGILDAELLNIIL